MTPDRAAEIKQIGYERAQAEARAVALNRGLSAKDANTLAAAVQPPLVAFSDNYHVYFLGEDSETVGRESVDHRVWNAVLAKLTAAGHTVVMVSADDPADAVDVD